MRNRNAGDAEPLTSRDDDELTLSGEPVVGKDRKGKPLSDKEYFALHGKTRDQMQAERRFVSSKGMEINYLTPPRSTTLSDVITVLLAHMLPFTPVPLLVIIALTYASYFLLGWFGPLVVLVALIYCGVTPRWYDREYRRKFQSTYLTMARYMASVRMVTPKDAIPAGAYIFAFHPHGRMFYSTSLIIQTNELWRKACCPQGDLFGSAAGGFFVVPIVRNCLNMLGLVPASKEAIVETLREKNHVTITIGGVKEICLGSNPNHDTLYLNKRMGFIKIAIEENVGIVPIYNFNENQIFKAEPRWFLRFWEWVNVYAGVGVPGMRGVWNLPMPFRKDLLFVVGKPLFPREGETVDELHTRYVEAVKDLFHMYVGISPHPTHKLVIT